MAVMKRDKNCFLCAEYKHGLRGHQTFLAVVQCTIEQYPIAEISEEKVFERYLFIKRTIPAHYIHENLAIAAEQLCELEKSHTKKPFSNS